MNLAQRHTMRYKYDEILKFLFTWGALFAYVSVGLLGKFGWDIVNNKRMTRMYVLGTAAMGYCIGFLAYEWCKAHSDYNSAMIVTGAALVSRDIMLFITMVDWYGVLKLLTGKGTKDKKGPDGGR